MELPTIQRGKRKLVKINEGQVFLLKSRVPHSPQRPEAGSLGLVIERSRCARSQHLEEFCAQRVKVCDAFVQHGAVYEKVAKYLNMKLTEKLTSQDGIHAAGRTMSLMH